MQINHNVVLRPRIASDIERGEPDILGGSEGETEPRRDANCESTNHSLMRVPVLEKCLLAAFPACEDFYVRPGQGLRH